MLQIKMWAAWVLCAVLTLGPCLPALAEEAEQTENAAEWTVSFGVASPDEPMLMREDEPEAPPVLVDEPEPVSEVQAPEALVDTTPPEPPADMPALEPVWDTQEPEIPEPPEMSTPEPVAVVTPEPTPFVPQGESWTRLLDGTILDGNLQDILDALLANGQSATVYLCTLDPIRVTEIPMALFDNVTLQPDAKTLGEEDGPYEVLVEQEDPTARMEDPNTLVIRVQPVPQSDFEPEGPEETPAPEWPVDATLEPTPEPTPAVPLWVGVADYTPGAWQNVRPTFVLSGIEPDDTNHVYAVFICDERLVLFSNGTDSYVPDGEGFISLRFAVFDMLGDVVALSDQYDMWIDTTPPEGPFLMIDDDVYTVAWVSAYDTTSGIEAISFDSGETWEPYEEGLTIIQEEGSTLPEECIWVRDGAGNISVNVGTFTFSAPPKPLPDPNAKKPIRHPNETMDYSLANYNALDLNFPERPVKTLSSGTTVLPLTLTSTLEDGTSEQTAFLARLANWKKDAEDRSDAPNTLVLTAQEEASEMNIWRFSGEVYRLLCNSGIEYIVFASGDYITAVPTAGFTGGTAYAKMKASGVSTRKFEYTLCQDTAVRETMLSVQVQDEMYLLEEDRSQPMYRYDVLVGTMNMMEQPYSTYLPGHDAAGQMTTGVAAAQITR